MVGVDSSLRRLLALPDGSAGPADPSAVSTFVDWRFFDASAADNSGGAVEAVNEIGLHPRSTLLVGSTWTSAEIID